MKIKSVKYISAFLIMCLLFTGCNSGKDEDKEENKEGENRYTGYTQANNIDSGISWPEDQALPIFATPEETLDTVSTTGLTADERMTFSSLQGLVNKTKPKILLTETGDVSETTWPSTLKFKRETYSKSKKYDLIDKYKNDVKGIVLYDTAKSKHYRNLASTIANVKEYIPVTQSIKEKLEEKGMTFTDENTVDITGLTYTTAIEIYDYLYDNYWKDCSKRLLISANPGVKDSDGGTPEDTDHNRDIAAAVKAAVIFCETGTAEGKAQYEKFLKDMADNGDTSIVLGWYWSERSGVTTASKYGIGTIPANYYISGSVYSGTDHKINIPKVPKREDIANKVYVAVYVSEGDNIQYMQRAMRKFWDEDKSSRGKTAVNWTMAPGMADIGPGILNYYYDSATDKECFVTGPSGMGFTYPHNSGTGTDAPNGDYLTDKKYADNYTLLTETYLQRAGIRVITIWDGCPDTARKSYEENCRNLYGLTVQNFTGNEVTASTENNRLRFELLSLAYEGSYDVLFNNLKNKIRTRNETEPLFLSYQSNRWTEAGQTANIVKLEKEIKAAFPDVEIEFVRADHYFSYYNEQNNMPFNLCMLTSTKVSTSDDDGSPENLTDGTPVTMWSSSKDGEKYMQFDFGKNYNISRYILRNAETDGLEKSANTKAWKVEVSTDGSEWTEAHSYKDNDKAVADIEMEAVTARYVKITILDSGDAETARITDVEIYGTKV